MIQIGVIAACFMLLASGGAVALIAGVWGAAYGALTAPSQRALAAWNAAFPALWAGLILGGLFSALF